ncbi:MAG: hypothetical protein NTW87_03745 [Planctomycetota bacterium]|nr:hypothetical protein [Planctomycetota bacterium]
MFQFTLYDPKTKKQFCGKMMTPVEAEIRNDQLRQQGRSQRWVPKEELPEDTDKSLIGLGIWK